MNTIALDIGQRTGWARSDGATGTLDLSRWVASSSPECDHGAACLAFDSWLRGHLRPGDTLITETAVFTGRKSLAGLTQGLMHLAYMHAARLDLPRREATASQWRKWLLGYGRAPKVEGQSKGAATKALDAAILAAVRARGFDPASEHAADAAGLLSYIERRDAISAGPIAMIAGAA